MVDYKSIEIDTALLLETLRNMQSYRTLTSNDSSMSFPDPHDSLTLLYTGELMVESPEYRSALRAVSQIVGSDGGVSKPKLTIQELEGVITPEVGAPDKDCVQRRRNVS